MKKIISVLIILCFAGLLASCGDNNSNNKQSNVDINLLAQNLFEKLEFDDELEMNDNFDKTLAAYNLDDKTVTAAIRYIGSGATAEEIAVFECKDAATTAVIEDAVKERIEYLHNGYADYGPEQVPEIDAARTMVCGNVVVFVICNNPEAVESIVNDIIE